MSKVETIILWWKQKGDHQSIGGEAWGKEMVEGKGRTQEWSWPHYAVCMCDCFTIHFSFTGKYPEPIELVNSQRKTNKVEKGNWKEEEERERECTWDWNGADYIVFIYEDVKINLTIM